MYPALLVVEDADLDDEFDGDGDGNGDAWGSEMRGGTLGRYMMLLDRLPIGGQASARPLIPLSSSMRGVLREQSCRNPSKGVCA